MNAPSARVTEGVPINNTLSLRAQTVGEEDKEESEEGEEDTDDDGLSETS